MSKKCPNLKMISWKSYQNYRNFGLLVGIIFLGISLWPMVKEGTPRFWLSAIAAILLVNAVIWPQGLAPFYKVWIKVGNILGWINTKIILGLIFYGIITPIGLTMRLLGKDPLRKKPDAQAKTYWVERPSTESEESMKYQF